MRNLAESILGFRSKPNPGIYLGFPVGISSRNSDFHFIIDKLQNHISLWKAKLLSPPGKVTLIKSVGMGVLNYYMQCLLLPKGVCAMIDRLFRNFFWGNYVDSKKFIFICWSTICQNKKRGGLGIQKCHQRNLCLASKLAWRILTDQDSTWAEVCRYQNTLSSSNSSNVGKAISAGLSLLNQHQRKIIFSGSSTSFWHDNWLPCGAIRHLIHGPLPLQEHNRTVSSMINANGSWDLNSLSMQLPPNILFSLISIPRHHSNNLQDVTTWDCCNGNSFDLGVIYNSIMPQQQPSLNLSWVWKINCHTRIRFFIWKILNNGLPTSNNLKNRGTHFPDFCSLCGQPNETTEHIFRFCPTAKYVRNLASIPDFDSTPPTFAEWIKANISSSTETTFNIPLGTLFGYIPGTNGLPETKKSLNNAHSILNLLLLLPSQKLLNSSS